MRLELAHFSKFLIESMLKHAVIIPPIKVLGEYLKFESDEQKKKFEEALESIRFQEMHITTMVDKMMNVYIEEIYKPSTEKQIVSNSD